MLVHLFYKSQTYFDKSFSSKGNCNFDPEDDLTSIEGLITKNIENFGLSWQVKERSPGACEIFDKSKVKCSLLPPEIDPCLRLMDDDIFGEVRIDKNFYKNYISLLNSFIKLYMLMIFVSL